MITPFRVMSVRSNGLALAMLCALSVTAAGQTTAPWAGKDTTGAALAIPAENKITVLAFLRPGQSQSDDIQKILTSLKSRADVQLIAIVSSDDAPTLAQGLTRSQWPAPIVQDPAYALSGKFAVKVWPTTVILTPAKAAGADATIVGHLAGLPASFASDLAAYMDFAAGKIDRAMLDKTLAARDVVAESPDQRAGRHVEVALRLATKGAADEAKAELAKALDLKPTEPPILLAIARLQLVLNNPQAAIKILDQLKEPAAGKGAGVTAADVQTLRGWAALQQQQWAEAKALLTQAAALNPNPSEAYYLLGRIAEHESKPAQAAAYYRKAFEKSDGGKQMGTIP